MTLSPGTKIGPYEIQAPLGSGGMGEVYRAHDSSLKRDVAIKVLPTFVSSDPDRLRRFEQEARAAAALNHPNILAVYQLGIYDGAPYLVSELLEGTTLREQIRRGPLAPRKVIDYGVQIARGLAAAHDKGIVHRDLKPENLFVTKEGRLKILDFGLAKLAPAAVPAEHNAPTMLSETGPGMVLGTVGYMSPEQVRGQTVDHRTDIFAFGAILYEMLSGKRAFQKTTSADTMSAVLNEDPPAISQLAPMSPPALQRVVHRCLEKNSEQRFQSAADLPFALDALSDSGTGTTAIQHPRQRNRWPWIAAAAVLVFAAGLAGWWYLSAGPKDSGPPPRLVPFTTYAGDKGSPAFSPDGNEIAFMWQGENPKNLGVYNIYVQLVGTNTPLRLTKEATYDDSPAWSPDARFIAFHRSNSLHGAIGVGGYYIVPALGGPERKLCDSYWEYGGGGISWSPDGKYLAIADRGPKEEQNASSQIDFVSVDTGERKNSGILMPGPFVSFPSFSPDGEYLAFASGPLPVSNDIYVAPVTGGKARALTSVHGSINGLAWTADGRQIVFDSDHQGIATLWKVPAAGGEVEPLRVAADNAIQPTIALRGNRIAFQRYAIDTNIWRAPLDPADHQPARKLIESTSEDSAPAYSPDGQRIAFASNRSGSYEIYVSNSDGSNPIALTSMKTLCGSPSWSADAKQIAFDCRRAGAWDIFVIDADGGAARPVTNGPQSNVQPTWSQDGKWLFFISNRAGDYQIWKVPVGGGDAVQITKFAAVHALESRDGQSLYYFHDQAIWKSDLQGNNELRVGAATNPEDYGFCGKYVCMLDRSAAPAGRLTRYDPATAQQISKPLDVGYRADVEMGVTFSPDGKWVVYTKTDSLQSDLMMVENFR